MPKLTFSTTVAFRLDGINIGALFSAMYIVTLTVEVLEAPGPLSSAWTVSVYLFMTSKSNDWLTVITPEA